MKAPVEAKQIGVPLTAEQVAFIAPCVTVGMGGFIREASRGLAAEIIGVPLPAEPRTVQKRKADSSQGYKAPGGRRTIPVHISATERHMFRAAAARRGLTAPDLMRMAALLAAEKLQGKPFTPWVEGGPDLTTQLPLLAVAAEGMHA